MAREVDLGNVSGPQGPRGEEGNSAYHIAVENGFEGTEQEWLSSLKGPKGDKGEKGDSPTEEELNTTLDKYFENNPVTVKTDKTLTVTDKPADAKAVGDRFEEIDGKIDELYESSDVYGFVEHMNIQDPNARIEYIGRNMNYTPLSYDFDNHTTDYGSWETFPTLVENKPYMVYDDGNIAYQLNENDYTKKVDGSSSDVSNIYFNGSAFSKIIKIYVKRWVDGNDRHVRFSYEPLPGFEACGFIDEDGSEMDHIWLPMFYGSVYNKKNAMYSRTVSLADTESYYNTCSYSTTDRDYQLIRNFSNRAAFFGGPIVETIKDILIMLCKTTHIRSVLGDGLILESQSEEAAFMNRVVGGGQFYGTKDKKSLNKIFHSIALGTYIFSIRDPYFLCVGRRFKVSTNYVYDVDGNGYMDTGIDVPFEEPKFKREFQKTYQTVPMFGSIPVPPYEILNSTGGCGVILYDTKYDMDYETSKAIGVCHRFKDYDELYSISTIDFSTTYNVFSTNISVMMLMRPPKK